MSYDIAIQKAWSDFAKLSPDKIFKVKFLADEYTVDLESKRVISLSGNVVAKDFVAILILHYLIQKLKGLSVLTGVWLTFKELSGIEGYYSAFRKRSIEPIIRKYGSNPQGILSILDRFPPQSPPQDMADSPSSVANMADAPSIVAKPAKRINQGDIGIVLEAFEGVPVLITFWRQDEEFGPEANMLFDKSISNIFCTEDIVVLAGMVASAL